MTKKQEKNLISLSSDILDIKGIGPKKAEHFRRIGINTMSDMLDYYPRSYEDLRFSKNICDIQNEEKVLVRAVVLMARPGKGFGRKRTMHLLVEDKTGRMEVLFFMGGFLKFEAGELYRFYGKCKNENGRVTMFHPTYSKEDGEEGGIVPVYPLTKGLTQKDLRNLSKNAMEYISELPESLPDSIVSAANICSNSYALKNIHFPEDDEKYKEARYRLVFEELFDLKTVMALSKSRGGNGRAGISFSGNYALDFADKLPYDLTKAQKRVLDEILFDMKQNRSMNRLVQGDVGSGKTVIAECAVFQAVKNGFQAAFMAPTEILATQHFAGINKDFETYGINVRLLTGSMSAKERHAAEDDIQSGKCDLVIGTHALISETLEFNNLGLVITDEQHRFGVTQRSLLSLKGNNPDVIVMTATPIPRTLAAVLYADMDVSVIDELPPGRVSIITEKFKSTERKNAYKLALDEVSKGRQVYVVAPFISESESLEGYSAEDLYEEFSKKHKEISCGLLHGQMKEDEKNKIMQEFYEGRISILFSTVVIEVGINVPNASVMIIENQERFGLAQLHQLRGRVGRGSYQSYCLLISGEETAIAKERADIMCKYSDGFKIAEKDLEMRGPGEIFGYRQHGLPQLRFADPIRHMKIAEEAGILSAKLLEDDPKLCKTENALFAQKLEEKFVHSDSIIL